MKFGILKVEFRNLKMENSDICFRFHAESLNIQVPWIHAISQNMKYAMTITKETDLCNESLKFVMWRDWLLLEPKIGGGM